MPTGDPLINPHRAINMRLCNGSHLARKKRTRHSPHNDRLRLLCVGILDKGKTSMRRNRQGDDDMTPEQWTALRSTERRRHADAMRAIEDQWESLEFPSSDCLRPCLADDIRVGQVIYYPENGRRDRFWQAVAEPEHYGDDFKAYTAESGCRYGLSGAFVRKEPTNDPR